MVCLRNSAPQPNTADDKYLKETVESVVAPAECIAEPGPSLVQRPVRAHTIWAHQHSFKYLTLTWESGLNRFGGYASDQLIWSIFMPQTGSLDRHIGSFCWHLNGFFGWTGAICNMGV